MKPKIEKETTKEDLLAKGYTPLTKQELKELISNTTVWGDYEYRGHRRYKTFMDSKGAMEGKNDWGSTEFGIWDIDDNGCLTVEWEGYWEDWSGVAFKVEDEIKFYDIKSGKWRTTFHTIIKGEQRLEVS